MTMGSICKRHIVTIDAKASLRQAAVLMREHHVGALVVVQAGADGTGPRVAGIVTDRDMAIEVLARDADASQISVGTLAQTRLVSVPDDADLAEGVALMQTNGMRRLLVHDTDGLLIGLVSFDDVLPACVAPLAGLADLMRTGLERELAERGAIAAPARPALRIPAMGTAGWTVS
jgi:CBS domain-containing protein